MSIGLSLFLAACAHTALAKTCRNSFGNQYQCGRYGNLNTAERIVIGVVVVIACLTILGVMAGVYRGRGRRRNRNLIAIHQPQNGDLQSHPPPAQLGSRPNNPKFGDVHTQEQSQYNRNIDGVSYPPEAHAAPPQVQQYFPPPYSPA